MKELRELYHKLERLKLVEQQLKRKYRPGNDHLDDEIRVTREEIKKTMESIDIIHRVLGREPPFNTITKRGLY